MEASASEHLARQKKSRKQDAVMAAPPYSLQTDPVSCRKSMRRGTVTGAGISATVNETGS
jgi:hypothetical protein